MKKRFNEFTEEEKEAIRKLNSGWFMSEMSDSYNVTRKEHAEDLENFNNTWGYNFIHFSPNFDGKEEYIYFE